MKTAKSMIFGLAALFSCTAFAGAEETAPVKATDAFALDFSAETDFYNFDEGLIVVAPSVGFKLFEVLDASVALPVYNDTNETGIGDLKFGANYGLLQSKTGLFGADSSTLSVGAEVGLPLDGQFASDSLTFTANGAFGLNWGKLGFEQTGSYLFDTNGEVYVPVFGGFIDGDAVFANSTLSYAFTDTFKVGVQFSQNYTDSTKFLTVGPTVDWNVSDTVALDLSAGFPVDQQDMPYGDCDFTVSAGLGFKF